MTRLALLALFLGATGCVIEEAADPVCGDGVREGAEECDDGNIASGDGCSSACDIEPYCGDGTQDPGEECDDGNNANSDGCSSTCEIEPYCGDGTKDPGEGCDDGNNDPSDGCSVSCTVEVKYATTANWAFSTVEAPNVLLPCPVGYDTVAVHSQALKADGSPVGTPYVDLFTCTQAQGTIVPVYQGRYLTWIEVTNSNGTLVYASSPSTIVDLTTSNQTLSTKIFTNGGYFQFQWNLVGATSNNALTCAQVAGIDGISLLSTNVANANLFYDDLFDCTDGMGLTAVLPAATYTISTSAIDAQGAALGVAPTLTNKVIQGPNKVTDLGAITIPIDGQ